jgi:hypothetical protein
MARKIKRKGTWLETEVAPGEVAHFRRPRQSHLADLRNAATTWHREFARSLRIRRRIASQDASDEDIEAVLPPPELVPGEEFEALSLFLTRITLKLEGPTWENGEPLVWSAMTEDERLDYFETLPFGKVPELYGYITMKLGIENNPALLEGLKQSLDADSLGEVGEEE